MEKKKKKEHFVPQSYLKSWAIQGTEQVYVYNKHEKKSYKSNIRDIASERYFYDVDFTDILTKEDLKKYGLSNLNPSELDNEQYIENFFATQIEDDFKQQISKLIMRATTMSAWERNNCFLLSEEDKFNLSIHLAFQHIRVRAVRNSIADSNNCLTQVLQDMGVEQKVIDQYTVPETQFPYIHGKMILDKQSIEELAQTYFSLVWIFQLNQTQQPFYTSDNPIGTQAHIHHPFMSMSGIKSRGVEAYFPLSPKLMLCMFDGDYHTDFTNYDRRIVQLEDVRTVNYCNSRSVLNSDRCVFSNTPDFLVIQEMIEKKPDIFEQPRTIVNWGGKTYTPKK